MKFNFWAIVVLIGTMLLVGCEPKVPSGTGEGESDKDVKNIYSVRHPSYAEVDGKCYILLYMFTEGLSLDLRSYEYVGSGDVIQMLISASEIKDEFVVNKRFNVQDAKNSLVAGVNGADGYQGTFLSQYVDGERLEGGRLCVVDGFVEFEGDKEAAKIYAEFILENGETRYYSYEGPFVIAEEGDAVHFLEPRESKEIEITFDSYELLNAGFVDYGNEIVDTCEIGYIRLSNGEWSFDTYLYCEIGTAENMFGTYTIEKSEDALLYKPGTAQSASGSAYLEDVFGAVLELESSKNEDGFYTLLYYIQSGTIEITEKGIVLDAYSYYGSHIKAKYEGEIKPIYEPI